MVEGNTAIIGKSSPRFVKARSSAYANSSRHGAYLKICKSVAEPFGPRERLETMKGIRQEFLENAYDAGETEGEWQIGFRKTNDRRLIEANVKPKSPAEHLRHVKSIIRLVRE
jgi:hypothetical protein